MLAICLPHLPVTVKSFLPEDLFTYQQARRSAGWGADEHRSPALGSKHWASRGECQPKGAVIPELKPCPPPLWAGNKTSQGVLISSSSESGSSSHTG